MADEGFDMGFFLDGDDSGGNEVINDDNLDDSTAGGNSKIEYEEIEDGFYKVPKDDLDGLVKGSMARDDYSGRTQVLSSLTQRLEETLANLEARQGQSKPTAEPAGDDGSDFMTEDELNGRMEDVALEHIKPIFEEQARQQIEEETQAFYGAHPEVFTGDPKQDGDLMRSIYSTASQYRKEDGSPLSLEEAYSVAYKDQLLGAISEMTKAEEQRRKFWGSDDGNDGISPQPAITSEAVADKVFKKRVQEMRGY